MEENDNVERKLDLLILEVKATRGQVSEIESTLVGGMKDSNEVGLLERVRKIESWISKREWFEKLIIAAVVGNLAGIIFVIYKIMIN